MKIRIICLIIIIYNMTSTGFAQDFKMLDPYQWKNRILLLFSSEEHNQYQQQLDVFYDSRDGLQERDIVMFCITDNQVKASDKKIYGEKEARQLRKQFQVVEGAFSIVLIGKDGTKKIQQDELLTMDKLFAVIDAMPMRKREIKKNNGN